MVLFDDKRPLEGGRGNGGAVAAITFAPPAPGLWLPEVSGWRCV
jgi:hypothetical protein